MDGTIKRSGSKPLDAGASTRLRTTYTTLRTLNRSAPRLLKETTPVINSRRIVSPISLERSFSTKEIFVMLDGSVIEDPNNLPGFHHKFHLKNSLNRHNTRIVMENFLRISQSKLHSTDKLRFIFSTSGQRIKSFIDIPNDCHILLLSSKKTFKGLISSEGFECTSAVSSTFRAKRANTSRIKSTFLVPNKVFNRPYPRFEKRMKKDEIMLQLKRKFMEYKDKVDRKLPKLSSQRASMLAKQTDFSLVDIYKFYAQYKNMLIMSSIDSSSYNVSKGISKSAFVKTLTIGNQRGAALLERLFTVIDANRDGFVDWIEFLHAMKILYFGTSGQKIDLLFKIYDTDGNGGLSYDEIKELCGLQLYFVPEDGILDYLSQSFASLIFDLARVGYDEELSPSHVKKILENTEDKPLIDMFCSFSFLED